MGSEYKHASVHARGRSLLAVDKNYDACLFSDICTEADEKEMAAQEKEIEEKTRMEVEALHDKLLWEKDRTTSLKRMEQDKVPSRGMR
jgi:hypothetical protein